jgi:LPS-assembly lipoprotein
MWSSDRRALLAALGAAALVAGCGFELRGTPQLPFRSVALEGFGQRSSLGDELQRTLARQVQVVAPASAEVVVHAVADERGRNVVGSTATAQVREFQLRLRFVFTARTPSGRELIPQTEMLLTRDLSYTETAALAKDEEAETLYREMQSDVVAQVVRRLASVHP